MKLFKRKSKNEQARPENTGMPSMNTVDLTTVLSSFDVHPLPYEHSYKFITDGINPLAHEKARLAGKTVDWLIHDKRDQAIEADSKEEIAYGKRQFTNHTYCVSVILAKNEGEICASRDQEKLLLDEIEHYRALEEELKKKVG